MNEDLDMGNLWLIIIIQGNSIGTLTKFNLGVNVF